MYKVVNCTEPSGSVVPCFASSASDSSYFERSNLIGRDRQEGEADELADEHADGLPDWKLTANMAAERSIMNGQSDGQVIGQDGQAKNGQADRRMNGRRGRGANSQTERQRDQGILKYH